MLNQQQDYTRRQVRNVVDDLQRKGDLKIEVLDRIAGLGIKADDMYGILQMVTDKLVELMFDSQDRLGGRSASAKRSSKANQIKLPAGARLHSPVVQGIGQTSSTTPTISTS